jgi:hypothetical protein
MRVELYNFWYVSRPLPQHDARGKYKKCGGKKVCVRHPLHQARQVLDRPFVKNFTSFSKPFLCSSSKPRGHVSTPEMTLLQNNSQQTRHEVKHGKFASRVTGNEAQIRILREFCRIYQFSMLNLVNN